MNSLEHPHVPNNRLQRTALCAAADAGRVCRAWHRTCEVRVPTPGYRGAEGEEKGKGVVARRGLKEAQSKLTLPNRPGT
jgi:hypothetical protein